MSTLVFYSEFDSFEEWSALLAPYLPGVTICRAETVQKPDEVHYALAWKPPRGFFAPYRNLRLLVNLGAGVDSLVGRNDLPDIPIIRLSDPDMARMMASYVLLLCCVTHATSRLLSARSVDDAGAICIRARLPASASACWG